MKDKILVADDEENIRYTFSAFLHEAGYLVRTVSSLSDCIKKLEEESFAMLFLDIGFGSENGLDTLREIKARHLDCPVVMMTGDSHPERLIEARRCGAKDYLVKPVRQASLLYITQKTLAQKVYETTQISRLRNDC